ncbi:hypothetical protein [Salinarimonas sp.]|uniref:hypothetical protein n=1 Tax=Salinarimonas sp. TaxID=2766526 RepID=UPI0032D90F89
MTSPLPPLAMAPDAQARIDRLEAVRDALRIARTPPSPPRLANAPLPPPFEDALIARAAYAAAHAPPPPMPVAPPTTPADASVRLWADEREPAVLAPRMDAAATPPAAIDPREEWRPAADEPAAEPVVVDPERLAADPRSLFSADTIEALRARHLGDVPIRAEAPAAGDGP